MKFVERSQLTKYSRKMPTKDEIELPLKILQMALRRQHLKLVRNLQNLWSNSLTKLWVLGLPAQDIRLYTKTKQSPKQGILLLYRRGRGSGRKLFPLLQLSFPNTHLLIIQLPVELLRTHGAAPCNLRLTPCTKRTRTSFSRKEADTILSAKWIYRFKEAEDHKGVHHLFKARRPSAYGFQQVKGTDYDKT